MDTFEIELPIIYKNYGKAPKHRNPDDYYVLSKAVVSIPVLDAAEMMPAVTAHFTFTDSDRVIHHSHEDRPVANGSYYDDVASLASVADSDFRSLPQALRVPSTDYAYRYAGTFSGPNVYEQSTIRARHVVRDGYDAAVSELQKRVDDTLLVVDGVIHAKAKDPVWSVWIAHDKIEVSITLDHEHPQFTFPADCEADALAFARDASAVTGLPVVERENGSFEIHATDLPHSTNPVVLAAMKLMERAHLNYGDGDEYGLETKRRGVLFKETLSPDDAIEFMEAFEKGAASSEDTRRIDLRTFEVFKAFLEHVPPRFLGRDSVPISIAQWSIPSMRR